MFNRCSISRYVNKDRLKSRQPLCYNRNYYRIYCRSIARFATASSGATTWPPIAAGLSGSASMKRKRQFPIQHTVSPKNRQDFRRNSGGDPSRSDRMSDLQDTVASTIDRGATATADSLSNHQARAERHLEMLAGRSAQNPTLQPTVSLEGASYSNDGDHNRPDVGSDRASINFPLTAQARIAAAAIGTSAGTDNSRHGQQPKATGNRTTKRDKKQQKRSEAAAADAKIAASPAAERVLNSAQQLASIHSDSIQILLPKKPRHRKLQLLSPDLGGKSKQPSGDVVQALDRLVGAPTKMEPETKPRFSRVIVTTTSNSASASAGSETMVDQCANDPSVARIFIKPLLVLDLNGILCFRLRREAGVDPLPMSAYRPSMGPNIAMTPVISRPDRHDFLDYLDRHFVLAIWTSAKAKTAKALVKLLIPDTISQKLLFVWAQHNCQVDEPPTLQQQHNEHEQALGSSSHSVLLSPSKVVYLKDLGQVWKAFPLWNQSNTLLMDDSPDKCVAWHQNAVHPPALNGLRNVTNTQLMSDEENVEWQREFFERLVAYWNTQSTVHDWDWEAGDALITNGDGHLRFVANQAGPHMGWKQHP